MKLTSLLQPIDNLQQVRDVFDCKARGGILLSRAG